MTDVMIPETQAVIKTHPASQVRHPSLLGKGFRECRVPCDLATLTEAHDEKYSLLLTAALP